MIECVVDKYNILAVDDEPFNLELIGACFIEYDNVEITNASSGEEALKYINNNDFDVVLLDISMPGMDGIEVLQKIRFNENTKHLPVLMVTANIEKETETLSKGATDFISKPYDVDVLCARTINYAKMHSYYKHINSQKDILEDRVNIRTKELQEALKLAKETEYEISTRLGLASEFRDMETGGHIKRMSHYSQLLAQLLGMDKDESELILYAAPLHDIGKVGIPDKILLKPGRFEPDEFEIMKKHSKIGAMMLEGSEKYPVLKAGHIIALQHHEKYDGSGYPNGLKEEDIHIYARIVAVADVFDALSSKRCYKEAMPLDKVLEIMKEGSGIHFDPVLIKLLLDNLDKFLEIKERFQDNSAHSIIDLIKE
jgi:putative two-component system response regulator